MAIAPGSVRGISFDYGHVLGGLDLVELRARLDAVDAYEVEPEVAVSMMRAAMPAAYGMHDAAIARGEGHEAAWRALIDTLLAAADVRDRPPVVDALWQAQPTRNLWRCIPDEARALVEELSRANVPMVITSNSEGHVRELLADVGLLHHFASEGSVLDSGVLGFAKPDARMFVRAAASLGVPLSAMVHIGDSEAADIVGAKRAGARAIRFDGFVPGAELRPTEADVRVSTFPELRACLRAALLV